MPLSLAQTIFEILVGKTEMGTTLHCFLVDT